MRGILQPELVTRAAIAQQKVLTGVLVLVKPVEAGVQTRKVAIV
jgi:hypothetical protein